MFCRVSPASRLLSRKKKPIAQACATLKDNLLNNNRRKDGGFHGETFDDTTTTRRAFSSAMRLSRASCGRRARAFDGRFRNAPLLGSFFFGRFAMD
jgi:hypothetical protein